MVVLDGELKKDSYLLSNSDGNYVKGPVEKIRQEGQGNARIKTSFMGGDWHEDYVYALIG